MNDEGQNAIHKTLIIRFSSVGDVLLSSLLCRVLRNRFPESTIDFVVKSEYADLVRHNPHLNHVVEFPPGAGQGELLRLRRTILASRYDLIIDIHDSLRSRILCLGNNNVVRINKRKLARFLLVRTKQNFYSSLDGSTSIALRYLETVASYGVQDDGQGLEVHVPEDARKRVEELLPDSKASPFIGLCPSARHATKIWLQGRFAETAVELARRASCNIILFGSGDEIDRCSAIEELIRKQESSVSVSNMAGKISLLETAAAMDFCRVVISNDSGLMHLAAARKRPVVAIFGSTVRELGFFPFGTRNTVVENMNVECRPCSHIGRAACPKGHFRCMQDIQSTQVIEAASSYLKLNKSTNER